MRSPLPILVALAGLAVLIALTIARTREGARDPASTTATASVETAGTMPAAGTPPASPGPSDRPAAAPVPGVIEGIADAERQRGVEIARLEAVWAGARRDAPTTAATLAAINAAIDDGPMTRGARFAPADVAPDCRQTLCRIEARFPPGTDGNEWATRLLLDMAGKVGTASTFTVPDRQGGSTVLLYAFRDGHAPVPAR